MNLSSPTGRLAFRAFTYTEMMISMSIFAIVVGGMIYSHLVGLQLNEWTARKLGADDQARRAFTKLQSEIRGATTILIGSG
ncbi:MAG: hypothetical protein HY300_20730, partial [Verrucomicrobia bacterium]|nr:hypothetical protein [Verrucomicrobiota bacterium]